MAVMIGLPTINSGSLKEKENRRNKSMQVHPFAVKFLSAQHGYGADCFHNDTAPERKSLSHNLIVGSTWNILLLTNTPFLLIPATSRILELYMENLFVTHAFQQHIHTHIVGKIHFNYNGQFSIFIS